MNPEQEMNEVLVSMEEVKEQIKNQELLEQLYRSPAFKKLILKDYFEKEAQQLVGMSAHPMNDMTKEAVRNKMVGISALQAFFNQVHRKGEEAKMALAMHEEEIAEMSAEV